MRDRNVHSGKHEALLVGAGWTISTRSAALLTLLIFLAIFAVASEKIKNVAELKAKADSARGGKKAKLYCELADAYLGAAAESFKADDPLSGQEAVAEAVRVAQGATEISISSGKRLKQTEIALRRLIRRLEDLKQTLAVDDRPALDEAVTRLEELRQRLFVYLFGTPARTLVPPT